MTGVGMSKCPICQGTDRALVSEDLAPLLCDLHPIF